MATGVEAATYYMPEILEGAGVGVDERGATIPPPPSHRDVRAMIASVCMFASVRIGFSLHGMLLSLAFLCGTRPQVWCSSRCASAC